MQLIFETHAPTTDNEAGVATGWLPGRLSARGVKSARELGVRRAPDQLSAIYTSDLARARDTAWIAFKDRGIPIVADERLRECHYGDLDGGSAETVHGDRLRYLDLCYPSGESWRAAVQRHASFLRDLHGRYASRRVLVIGHSATLFAFQHLLGRQPLDELLRTSVVWQPGWSFIVPD